AEAGSADAVQRPAGYEPAYRESGENPAELLARGEELYYDTSLSTNGLSCATCHGSDGQDMGYSETFEEVFPHRVAMAENQFGLSEVHADEMVQICMVAPMQGSPLDWGARRCRRSRPTWWRSSAACPASPTTSDIPAGPCGHRCRLDPVSVSLCTFPPPSPFSC
ncbi:hypothetical protein, partial [Halomonas campaniensis]|uniref:hypothetical protein n=1 Tax=Halomonas campaniensis TaxID=213554 RepID=UPI0035668609